MFTIIARTFAVNNNIRIMKRKLTLLMAALLCFAAMSKAQDFIEVTLIEQLPDAEEQKPRSLFQVPITCYVVSNTIYLNFSNDIGEVDVTLEEASQGIILQTSVDSSELSAILPFGGAAGEYTITFTLPTGVLYIGGFSIIL